MLLASSAVSMITETMERDSYWEGNRREEEEKRRERRGEEKRIIEEKEDQFGSLFGF